MRLGHRRALFRARRLLLAGAAVLALHSLALAPMSAWARPQAQAPPAASGPSVYWDNPQAGAVGVATGPPSQIDQRFIQSLTPTHSLSLAADGQHLYWTSGGAINRAGLDGSGVTTPFIAGFAGAVATDSQHIYWTSGRDIARANLDGSGVDTQFISVPGAFLSGLAVDSAHVYWKDLAHRAIGRASIDGTGLNETFITGAGASVGGVAVDAQHIYWTNITGSQAPFVGTIGRANIDGTGATLNFITGADNPRAVSVDSTSVYWANRYSCNYQNDPPTNCGGGTIGRANLDGSQVNQDFITALTQAGPGCGTSPETRCGPTSVVAATLPDGTSAIYWDNPQVGTIGRETTSGDPANVNQSLLTGLRQLDHIGVAADSQHLYWTDGALIGRSNLDGRGANQQFIQLQQATNYLALDDQHLYWPEGGGIGRAGLDGSDVTNDFVSLPGINLGGIAVDSYHIYWTDRVHGTIGRANLDGTGANPNFITGLSDPTDVAVDGQYVYWSEITTNVRPPAGAIGRANLDGTGANPNFIPGAAEPFGIAVDYAHIYWANGFNCDYVNNPPTACAGGTVGRANLDGAAADRSYITADEFAGPGCGTSPQTRCGPTRVAVTPPTQPVCLRTTPTPAPPPGGAVFARPLNPGGSGANVVVLGPGASWTGDASCLGVAQGTAQVMSDPASITVSPDAAVKLSDSSAGLTSAWGAQNAGAGNPAPVLFPGRPDWTTTEADIVAPQQLLATEGGCPDCVLPDNLTVRPLQPSTSIAYQDDVSNAVLNGATLTGDFDGWNLARAQLPGAILNGTQVSGADFTAADLRGAQLTALQFTTPPTFANVRVGALGTACTVFKNSNLVGTGLTPVKADLLVSGCANTPLLPMSTAPLDLIKQLTLTDGATIDYANATFLATAANRTALAGAGLQNIDLAGASFIGFPADFESTAFDGASLAGTSFELADLTGATLTNVKAPAATFDDAELAKATFAGASTDLENALFIDADLTGASFQDADITDASFDGALAVGTNFNSVIAPGARFIGAHIYGDGNAFTGARQLTNAKFDNAVLGGSESGGGGFDLTNADLTGASFVDAQCISCNFTSATLTGATFTGADLPGAQLSNATLQNASFDNAWLYCGDLSDDSCRASGGTTLSWPLQLGSQESYGPVPFTTTTLNQGEWTDVTVCPDAMPPSATSGCQNQMLPGGTLSIPAPCTAVALDACVTPTSTLFDAGPVSAGSPLAVVPATPPTWASALTTKGYDAGFTDGTIRRVGGSGPAPVLAGAHGLLCPDPTNPCGDGGPATKALLGTPAGLAVGLDGSLYVADPSLRRVRRIDPSSGTITTVAGTGQACSGPTAACGDGGPATAAALGAADGVWSSPSGALYIADGNRGLREVLPDGTITTVPTVPAATTGTYDVVSVVGDAGGNLYVTTNNPDYLLQLPPGGQPMIAVGTGTKGYNGNSDPLTGLLPGTSVQINHPEGLSVALNGDVLFADTGNSLIRAFVPSTGFVADVLAGAVDASGDPQSGFNGDGQDGNATELNSPAAVTATRGALVVIADTGNGRVRQFGPNPLSTQLGHLPPPPPPLPGGGHQATTGSPATTSRSPGSGCTATGRSRSRSRHRDVARSTCSRPRGTTTSRARRCGCTPRRDASRSPAATS